MNIKHRVIFASLLRNQYTRIYIYMYIYSVSLIPNIRLFLHYRSFPWFKQSLSRNSHDVHRVTYHNQSWHWALGEVCNLPHTGHSHSSCNSHSHPYWSTSSDHCCKLSCKLRGGWGREESQTDKPTTKWYVTMVKLHISHFMCGQVGNICTNGE